MSTTIAEHTIGLWFCDIVKGESNFFGHLYRGTDETHFFYDWRVHYTKEGTKNWYHWKMNTSDPDEVLDRIDYMLHAMVLIGFTLDSPIYTVIRAPGQTMKEFYEVCRMQPWFKVLSTHVKQ